MAIRLGRPFDTKAPRNRFAASSHGVLGHDGRTPDEIRALGRSDLAAYPTVQIAEARVTGIAADGNGLAVQADGLEDVQARRVILAYGLKDELP